MISFKFSSSVETFFNEMSMSDKMREISGNLLMVEDAARLDYIKDKKLFVMLNVRRAFKSVSDRTNSW